LMAGHLPLLCDKSLPYSSPYL